MTTIGTAVYTVFCNNPEPQPGTYIPLDTYTHIVHSRKFSHSPGAWTLLPVMLMVTLHGRGFSQFHTLKIPPLQTKKYEKGGLRVERVGGTGCRGKSGVEMEREGYSLMIDIGQVSTMSRHAACNTWHGTARPLKNSVTHWMMTREQHQFMTCHNHPLNPNWLPVSPAHRVQSGLHCRPVTLESGGFGLLMRHLMNDLKTAITYRTFILQNVSQISSSYDRCYIHFRSAVLVCPLQFQVPCLVEPSIRGYKTPGLTEVSSLLVGLLWSTAHRQTRRTLPLRYTFTEVPFGIFASKSNNHGGTVDWNVEDGN